MDLTIQQLRMLREVSARGTIASAAEHLGYTPSAVSQQLSSAEKVTGIAMLERVGRNVLLTDAGHELVAHADIILEQMELAKAAIERVQGEVAGVLRLGFIESVSSTLLGPIMKLIRTKHPELAINTMAIDGLWPAQLIRSGELHVSFVVRSPEGPAGLPDGFSSSFVCRDWFRLVVPAGWFDGERPPKSIDLSTMTGRNFIAPPTDDACGRAAVQACRDAGLDPFVAHRVADYPTTLRLVGAQAGIALVPDLGLQRIPDDVIAIDLVQPRCRTVDLLYRTSSASRPAMRAFIDAVHTVAEQAGLDRTQ